MADFDHQEDLDPELVDAMLDLLDRGEVSSLDGLSESFPDRADHLRAAIAAIDRYQLRCYQCSLVHGELVEPWTGPSTSSGRT